jgi:hypothetical protein
VENVSVPLALILLFYAPGAVLYRLPIANRARRAALGADERVFWYVMLSIAWSLSIGFALAALEQYRFERVLLTNGVAVALVAAIGRRRLFFGGEARRLSPAVALPIVLVLLGVWRFYPASEYIIGGRDPGTYMNEGIQIAQRGTLTIHDPLIGTVPSFARDLFFPSYNQPEYYSVRFMGFFVRDAATGDVNGQFPQLFPLSIAFGYGVNGLTGARLTTGVWGILGVLALYFAGARFVGRPAAFAAATLLGLNVAQVWFARYPNSELVAQTLLMTTLLAFARAHQEGDSFFAPIAGIVLGLVLFARIDALPPIAAVLAAALLGWLVDLKPPRILFLVALAISIGLAWLYYTGPLLPYTARLIGFLQTLPMYFIGGGVAFGFLCLVALAWLRRRIGTRVRTLVPSIVSIVVIGAAIYAAFFREPGGRLAEFDAHALRNFTTVYLTWAGLAAGLIGFALVNHRAFWRDPAFVLVFVAMALFFFYKPQIPPGEFWAGRRWLPVVLPGALLFVSTAALGMDDSRSWRLAAMARTAAGAIFLCVIGYQYAVSAAPVIPHVEYAGMIPYVERLAHRFNDRDLVLVEARNAGSDTHVLAVPLAYIYARNVLVLNSPRPDKVQLHAFLEQAMSRYDRVLFVGGGGTDLLSRRIGAIAIAEEPIKVPEFETRYATLPQVVKRKDFDYSIYQFALNPPAHSPFVLDVGYRDDLHVLRFNAKETTDGRTVRWTGPQSVVAVPGMTGAEREVSLVMHDGGRPIQAPPAHVEVFLNDVRLGDADITPGFRTYRFPIPAGVAADAGRQEDPAQLRLVSSVWTPQQYFGGSDDRTLGVMLDRVEVR